MFTIRNFIALFFGFVIVAIASAAFSHGNGDSKATIELVINQPTEPVSQQAGYAAWKRIFEVVSHPRCANCHVDENNTPMWSGPSYGETRPHGMYINAGTSGFGV